ERIIYLGALGNPDDPKLSKHIRSRHEVGKIFESGPVPATVLRAAMILGSGSASFEMLRYLVDRLPVMLTPAWVRTPVQPIGIGNVLEYLQGCLENEETVGKSFDIGGPEILTYEQLIHIYAEVAGLPRRRIIPIPVLSPYLSALWIHIITPVPASIAQPLAEGLANEVVCQENRIRSIIPIKLKDCRETIRLALEKTRQQRVETCWTDAGALLPPEWTYCGDAQYAGGTILECGHRIRLQASAEEIWEHVVRIGGETGWYFGDLLWKVRGTLDRLVGGTGLRRGRRHPSQLYTGDALDFWRVLEVDAPHRLLLLAEMKTPGEAILEFKLTPMGENQTELQQLSRFLPRGLLGILYWYILYPFHVWIFGGMLRTLSKNIGKPILKGPERFTPKLKTTCRI
ncbi:MAG: SDR family oxidoreductase, partial [Deltaproteobacteria bacterium]|nr:SDR family oxidoreductase [Deltaproteobacteria bacterium]